MQTVNILGTEYKVLEASKEEDSYLEKCDGYCDKTAKKIVIIKEDKESELEFWNVYRAKIIRHEIIHAFLFESGLHENFEHASQFGHEETMIDWVAVQFPKILKVYQELGVI